MRLRPRHGPPLYVAISVGIAHHAQGHPVAFRWRLRDMAALLNTVVHAVRRIGTDLRPDMLDDLGLTAAIEWQLQEVCKRTGMAYQLELPAEEIALGQAQTTAIFRIFQEALTNVLRHAAATKVRVCMGPQPNALVLQITAESSLSVKTVSTHRSRMLEKMRLQTNAELIRYAIWHRLVD